ncbi:MAG: TerD family protein [Treponema sp.]|jgi:tellurium resistance protein TerD|nr:TerD family protein [Treponema sp.]
MAVSLQKGQKVDLTKGNVGLSKVLVGLGWDTNKYDGGADFDLDTSAFLLDKNGRVTQDADFVFYHNLEHFSGAVHHSPDDTTGGSSEEGDDEWIRIELNKIPSNYQRVVFTVTIHEAESRKQNFGMVNNAYIRIVNDDTNKELIRYDLGEDFSVETAVIAGEIYREGGEWKFSAIGSGSKGNLASMCKNYGVDV